MKRPPLVVVAAIGSLTAIELFALAHGINGVLMSISVAAISGLGGYPISKWLFGKRENVKEPANERIG